MRVVRMINNDDQVVLAVFEHIVESFEGFEPCPEIFFNISGGSGMNTLHIDIESRTVCVIVITGDTVEVSAYNADQQVEIPMCDHDSIERVQMAIAEVKNYIKSM